MAMITATLASAFFSVVGVARRQVQVINSWRQARQDYAALCEMDDKTLADLGLSRGDLRDATAAGYFGDPTVIVATRAAERGHGRRPQVVAVTGPSIVPDVVSHLPRVATCN
ncbi:DUF1127 domain-containing protein [Phreatobacter stygius]|nr:DUF1127 domain-containing protein [Phreatobacter stygius]